MGSSHEIESNTAQSVTNKFISSVNQTCSSQASCNENNISITEVNCGGKITGGCNATASANCVMDSVVSDEANNVLNSLNKQGTTLSKGLFNFNFDSQKEVSNVSENITNAITQIVTATCKSNATANLSNVTVLQQNCGAGGGGIDLTNSADASSHCMMRNMSKITAYNSAKSKIDQKEKQSSIFGVIALVIGVVVIVGIVVMMLVFDKAKPLIAEGIKQSGGFSGGMPQQGKGSKGMGSSQLLERLAMESG